LTADPTTVEKGQSVTLHWSSQNATELDLAPGVGQVEKQGSMTVTPQYTTKYTLTASGPGGKNSTETNVSVMGPNPPPPPPPPRVTLSVSPSTVEKGRAVTLRWSSQYAAHLDLEPDVGRVPPQGTQAVTPQQTTTYTLTAYGSDGTKVQQEAQVSVRVPIPENRSCQNDHDVKGKITLGEFHQGRGEYDEAIAAFKAGLKLCPSSTELQKLLAETVRACKSERDIMHRNVKCEAP
jgi:hypothetical protein